MSEALQQVAQACFKELGYPTRKMEAWKYMNLEPILSTPFVPSTHIDLKNEEAQVRKHFLNENEKNRLVFVNGIFSSALSSAKDLPEGVRFGPLSEFLENDPSIQAYLGRGIAIEPN